jgi:cell division protein ZapA (FtsZ GTPase activity inhibitor)
MSLQYNTIVRCSCAQLRNESSVTQCRKLLIHCACNTSYDLCSAHRFEDEERDKKRVLEEKARRETEEAKKAAGMCYTCYICYHLSVFK